MHLDHRHHRHHHHYHQSFNIDSLLNYGQNLKQYAKDAVVEKGQQKTLVERQSD